jgi:hypothetical protein
MNNRRVYDGARADADALRFMFMVHSRITRAADLCRGSLTEKPQVVAPRGREYGCGYSGAGQLVVAVKSPIKGWRKGAVSRSLIQ